MILKSLILTTRKLSITVLALGLLVLLAATLYRNQTFIQDTSDVSLEQYAARKRTTTAVYKAYLQLPESTRRKWTQFMELPPEERQDFYQLNKEAIDRAARATVERLS